MALSMLPQTHNIFCSVAGEKVCVQSENDAATILFLGGEWGYMQVIDYEIQ